ncbi:hypothetical protein QVD17_11628 [Tagetes erecta]|uniref:Uncharacterized protein n=1 Tax=Tagetes erecta TaxID=13708 RepID=A0AAD8KTU4_TARER|nr:hypothetical protein QVD17_11628 [Tagetes erecta]
MNNSGGNAISHSPWYKKMEQIVGNSLPLKSTLDEDKYGGGMSSSGRQSKSMMATVRNSIIIQSTLEKLGVQGTHYIFSTDTAAALRAVELHADVVIKVVIFYLHEPGNISRELCGENIGINMFTDSTLNNVRNDDSHNLGPAQALWRPKADIKIVAFSYAFFAFDP